METRVLHNIHEVSAPQWDALVGKDDPFVEHRFLALLEDTGVASEDVGWKPAHITAWQGDELVAALPLYIKDHSYGEFIFDWDWAHAAQQAGINYYPKLLSMAPVTPATGKRILHVPHVSLTDAAPTLVDAAIEYALRYNLSSLHLLFLTEDECNAVTRDARMTERASMQFHWHNDGYQNFDDMLLQFRNASRKQVRKERKRAAESGLSLRLETCGDLNDRDWDTLFGLYRHTCRIKGSPPYLTRRFFEGMCQQKNEHLLVATARAHHGDIVAASINFQKGAHIYGRYWGAREEVDCLHFELCYYRLIEHAIHDRLQRFEAGAQGMHKLKRGLLPQRTYSAHWIQHPEFFRAVRRFLKLEGKAVQERMEELRQTGPFKRDPS